MLEQGLEQEVRALLETEQLSPPLPALRSVGYRQVAGYLQGHYGRVEMIEKAIAATRQLAKRQLTWLRSDSAVHWLYDEDGDPLGQALELIHRELLGPGKKTFALTGRKILS
jgi:tRNA dimethylallyltransferase